jgi:hypothetical protein
MFPPPNPLVHKYYVRFKKNSICSLNNVDYYNIIDIKADENTIFVSADTDIKISQIIHYNFDSGFNLKEIILSKECKERYRNGLEAGLLEEPLEDFT